MKTLILTTLVSLCLFSTAIAQTPRDEYRRLEFYGGVTTEPDGLPVALVTTDGSAASYLNKSYKGFEGAAAFNLSRYWGLKADFVGLYGRHRFVDPDGCPPGYLCVPWPPLPPDPCRAGLSCPLNSSLYQLMGGVQFKDNALTTRVKPFGHVLAGGARLNLRPNPDDPNPPLCPACKFSGFAAAVGGGLDVRLNRHFDLRVIQLDYNPTRLGDQTQHNLRLGAGLVFR